jgi:hypothetical protein
MSETPIENPDPWESPPSNLDPDLVETSRRMVAKSEATYAGPDSSPEGEFKPPLDPRLIELEQQNKYLFDRNANLVAKLAQVEAANSQLQEKIAQLQKSQQPQRPWFLRWLNLS